MILLNFLIAGGISLSGMVNSPKVDIIPSDYKIGIGFDLQDDRVAYEFLRQDGINYYSLISNMDLVTSTQFHLLPIKSVWYLEGNVYDREMQAISVQNISAGGCAYLKGLTFRLGGGASYNNYSGGAPCVFSEIRYSRAKEKNIWSRIINAVMIGSDYDIIVSGLFSKSRAEYKFAIYNSFHITSIVSFTLNSEYFKNRDAGFKKVDLGLKFKL